MPVIAALQNRSKQTLNRILDATETLLNEKGFDEIGIAEVVEKAGSSTGSFYARFSNKEALRACLIERYHQDLVEISLEKYSEDKWRDKGIRERAEAFINGVITTSRQRRGLMRMRYQHHIAHPDSVSLEGEEKMNQFNNGVYGFFAHSIAEVNHPAPKLALEFGIQLIDTTIASSMLLTTKGKKNGAIGNEEVLSKETARAFLAYLGVVDNHGSE